MKAMVLNRLTSLEENQAPLELAELPNPLPGEHEILIKVSACGVCHTELDEIEGRTPPPRLPVVLGHQVVGRVVSSGPPGPPSPPCPPSPPRSGGSGDSQPRESASPPRSGGSGDSQPTRFNIGDRVGVAWIYSACGHCKFCLSGNENLCADFRATGRDANGGYAQYMTVREDFAYPIPDVFSDVEAAPLLCAGAIGYRSLMLANLQDGQKLGLTGFGASAHLVLKMVRHHYPGVKVFVFARSAQEQAFARELSAVWAGDTLEESPEKLDSIIDTTPVWTGVRLLPISCAPLLSRSAGRTGAVAQALIEHEEKARVAHAQFTAPPAGSSYAHPHLAYHRLPTDEDERIQHSPTLCATMLFMAYTASNNDLDCTMTTTWTQRSARLPGPVALYCDRYRCSDKDLCF